MPLNEGEENIGGYLESEPPTISNLEEIETDGDDFADGCEHRVIALM